MWRSLSPVLALLAVLASGCAVDTSEPVAVHTAARTGEVAQIVQPIAAPVATPTATPAPTPTVDPRPTPTAEPLPTPTATPVPLARDILGEGEFLPLVDGGRLDLATAGQGDTVLWFWAPWWPHCKTAAPAVAELQQQYPDIEFIGVGLDGTNEELLEFTAESGTTFPHISAEAAEDEVSELNSRYQVLSIPTFVFIDANGDERTQAGWRESSVVKDLDWLANS